MSCLRNSTHKLKSIILKLCRHFLYGLKIACHLGIHLGFIPFTFFHVVNLVMVCLNSIYRVAVMRVQLLRQIITDLFETLQTFSTCSEDFHTV